MSADTKAALLDAAKRLIRERGYAGTSVRDVSAAAEANVAAVSYHFGSREQLLSRAVLDAFVEWTDRLTSVAGGEMGSGTPRHLGAMARAMLDDLPATEPLFAGFLEAVLQARRTRSLRGQLADHYARQRARVGAVVRAGVGAELAPATIDVLASVLIAIVDGLLLQSLLDGDAVPSGDRLAALLEGLAGAASSPQATAGATAAGRG